MLRQIFYLITVLTAGMACVCCNAAQLATPDAASGFRDNVVTRTVNVKSPFSGVRAEGIYRVEIKSGTQNVEIVAEPKYIEMTKFVNEGGVLTIKPKDKAAATAMSKNNAVVRVMVSMPRIEHVEGSGVARFMINGNIDTGDLTLNFSGTSKASFKNIKCMGFKSTCSGASKVDIGKISCSDIRINVSGSAGMDVKSVECVGMKAEMSGASNTEIEKVSGNKCKINVSGASGCKIDRMIVKDCYVVSSGATGVKLNDINAGVLTVNASGASNVKLSGSSDTVNFDTSGASNVKANEFKYKHKSIQTSGASNVAL